MKGGGGGAQRVLAMLKVCVCVGGGGHKQFWLGVISFKTGA